MGDRGPEVSCECGLCLICRNRESNRKYYYSNKDKINKKKRDHRQLLRESRERESKKR